MNKKPTVQLSKQDQERLINELITYFKNEFDYELGNLEAGLLLNFLDEKIAKTYYNQGVLDTIAHLREKTEDLIFLVKDE